MTPWSVIRALLGGNGLIVGLIVGLVTTALLWDRGRINRAEQRGAATWQAHTEAANAKGVDTAGKAGALVRDPRSRGVQDPNFRGQ